MRVAGAVDVPCVQPPTNEWQVVWRWKYLRGDSPSMGDSPGTLVLNKPDIDDPFIPQEWVHRYHRLALQRGSDCSTKIVPCTAANFFLMDLNPRWYVDRRRYPRGLSVSRPSRRPIGLCGGIAR